MAISINWGTKVIFVPKSYLTPVTGTLYELDTNKFRLDLKNLEDSDYGIAYQRTHRHNTEVTVAGVTYARTIEIINGYKVEFENGFYSVRLVGSNNNIFDIQNGILVQNNVQVIPGNSAGLQVVVTGSGVTEQDKKDIANEVWNKQSASGDTYGQLVETIDVNLSNVLDIITEVRKYSANRTKIDSNNYTLTIYDDDGTTPYKVFDLKDSNGVASFKEIFERIPA